MSRPDLVVIGGGAIGLCVAWRASVAGLDVIVVDDPSQRGATWVAAGMLAPVTEATYGEEELLRLNLASSEMYPAFIAELEESSGLSTGYRRCGTLMVARDNDDNAALEELFRFQKGLELRVERLSGTDARALEPRLSPRTRGGLWVEGDHQVDPRALLDALVEACKRTGASMRDGRVVDITQHDGRATGVRLADGDEISSETLVLCAGAWSGTIGIPAGVLPPIRPVKGQLLQLRGSPSNQLASRNIRGLDVYVITRSDGRVVVGATVEEKGFDETITAGAIYELLRHAYELLPDVVELEFVGALAGLRPGSPDNGPALGETKIDGLLAATGHYRNGVLLAPVTADVVVELVTTGRTPEVATSFSPRRFGEGP